VAGTSREIFTPDALKAVYRYASGLPRLTNIVCDHALMTGYVRGVHQIDADIVNECGNDLKITIGVRPPAEKRNPRCVRPQAKPHGRRPRPRGNHRSRPAAY